MKRTDYTEFDKALLSLITVGVNTMAELESRRGGLRDLAEPHRTPDRYGILCEPSRVINRRLQALRKRGTIRFNGKSWVRA